LIWSPTCQNAFEKLKKYFTLDPILHHFDLERKAVVKMDTSFLVVAGIPTLYHDKGILYLVAYFSRKHLPTEINYMIYNKELLTIICAFQKWHPFLKGFPHTIGVISDHQNLIYFTTNKQ
jgi:hypothetical protein